MTDRVRRSLDVQRAHRSGSRSRKIQSFLAMLIVLLTVTMSPQVQAHDVPPSVILLDIGTSSIDVELQLPMNDLSLAMSLPLNVHPQQAVTAYGARIQAYLQQHLQAHTQQGAPFAFAIRKLDYQRINNGDWIVVSSRLLPPTKQLPNALVLDYDAIITPVVSHNALLSIRHDFRHGILAPDSKPTALIGFNSTHLVLDLSGGSWWRGFSSVFALGMKHIAEGTDHMLFLLALLLPAPLVAAGGRWRQVQTIRASVIRIVRTVSGFTLGHSLTLLLGALGWIAVPNRPIEVLIAVSILVSAWHAMRPIVADKELYVAAGFGLIHGLAFASSLAGLGYDSTVLASSVLGFNLGIEVMQLAIVVAVLPWLILLSRTVLYTAIRWAAAGFAAVAALGWIVERAFGLMNPMAPAIDLLVDSLASHALVCIATVASISLAIAVLTRGQSGLRLRR